MKTPYFSLIDEPWIPVHTDECDKEVSLHELFQNANKIKSLICENEYVNFSICFILMSILYTAYSRSEYRNSDILKYDPNIIMDYFDSYVTIGDEKIKVYDLFNLYDPKHPFLQIPLQDVPNLSTARLYEETSNSKKYTLSSGSTTPRTFEQIDILNTSSNKSNVWCLQVERTDAWVARQFLTYRIYHPGVNGGSNPPFMDFYFTPIFMFSNNLCDFFNLNYKNSWKEIDINLKPEWEVDYLTEWDNQKGKKLIECNEKETFTSNFNKFITDVKIDKNNKKKSGYYFDIRKKEYQDVARILSYSNAHYYLKRVVDKDGNLDIKNSIFYIGANVPLRLKRNKDSKNKKIIYELEDVCRNIFLWYSDVIRDIKGTETLYKNTETILNDLYLIKDAYDGFEYIPEVCYMKALMPPNYDEHKVCIKSINEPLLFYGNSLFKSKSDQCDNDEETDKDITDFATLCDRLDKYHSLFKGKIRNNVNDCDTDEIEKLFSDVEKQLAEDIYQGCFMYLSPTLTDNDRETFIDTFYTKIKNKAYSLYSDLFINFMWKKSPSYFYRICKLLDNKKGEKEMKPENRNFCLSKEKSIQSNLFSYITKVMNPLDTAMLQDLRKHSFGKSFITPDNYNPMIAYHPYKLVEQAILDTLYVWSNHQHVAGYDKDVCLHKQYNSDNAEGSFGYILYILLKNKNENDREALERNYIRYFKEFNQGSLDFMVRCIKEAIKIEPSIQMDYGSLVESFLNIKEQKSNLCKFIDDVRRCFALARYKDSTST